MIRVCRTSICGSIGRFRLLRLLRLLSLLRRRHIDIGVLIITDEVDHGVAGGHSSGWAPAIVAYAALGGSGGCLARRHGRRARCVASEPPRP
jgi:hypothetical protein